jgi:hypothetical protein
MAYPVLSYQTFVPEGQTFSIVDPKDHYDYL